MPAGRDALRQALVEFEGPLGFASKSDKALANLRNLSEVAVRAATAARNLRLSRADAERLDRIVASASSFDRETIDRRRVLLTSIQADLAAIGTTPPEPEPAPMAPRPRIRSLSANAAQAPAVVDSDELQKPLTTLRGVGPKAAEHLAVRGLRTLGDVLLFLPRLYEDRRQVTPIAQAKPGTAVVVRARIVSFDQKFIGRRMYELRVRDDTGMLLARWFGMRPAAYRDLEPGTVVILSGDVREPRHSGPLQMMHPDLEVGEESDDDASFGRIIPVYTDIKGVSARHFRKIALRVVDACAQLIPDFLPEPFRKAHDLVELRVALGAVHFPSNDADIDQLQRFSSPAQRRLVFDELFFLQVGLALKKRGVKIERGIPMVADEKVLARATERLPFKLTGAQSRALHEIARDAEKATPMNRLLQGDVGSGKTAVALAAALIAVENGYQAAVMAPTELLAEQHLRTFERLLGADLFGKRELPSVRVGYLSAGRKPRELERTRNEIASGTTRIAIGTHALIQEGVQFQKLGLVVIDEQHRFGVLQRARLMEKGVRPHVLVMTATPIPRTLALTLYGDLDVSIIDELPPGRTPVATRLIRGKARSDAYEFLRSEVSSGRQAYVVLPLVEESEKIELRAATEESERLQREELSGLRVGLVHGRMTSDERTHAMELFRRGETQVLVATTVIEVGVDVPNASVMVIDHAERFGLSQLHQLRGRVGRGAAKSHCLLVAEEDRSSADAWERLRTMVKTNDGFRLAEKDLELRGPGEFLGTRQSGIPDLVVADLLRDQGILKEAREAAFALVERDPELKDPALKGIAAEVARRWAGKMSLGRIG